MLDIVYEDNHVIAVVKPSGVPSQMDKSSDEDMLTMVKQYIKEKYNKPGAVYVGLIHRLDRSVSGIMVFAKTSKAASRLSENIRNGDFKKEYVAIVKGTIPLNEKKQIENYIYKDERTNTSCVVTPQKKNAKKALLEYECVQNIEYKNEKYSKVHIWLKTGRHHQIRVQMSNIGHPLYGDIKYGGNKGNLALFACKVSFIHPTKDEIITLERQPNNIEIWGI